MYRRCGIDELRCYANTVRRLAHAAFKDIANAQVMADLLHIDSPAFVDERRIASDDEKLTKSRQCRDDVFDHPIGKVLLFRITTHVLKRQDRNRWLVGQ